MVGSYGAELLEDRGLGFTVIDYILDGRGVGEDLEEGREELGVGEYANCVRFVEGVGETGFTKGIVSGGDGDGDGGTGVCYDLPVGAVKAEDELKRLDRTEIALRDMERGTPQVIDTGSKRWG